MSNSIFFVHKGNQSYVKDIIKHAKRMNPNVEVVVLGNKSNEVIENIKLEYIDDYSEKLLTLKNVFNNYSENSYDFEFFCISRWFVILEYMEKNNIDKGCHLDSDVIINFEIDFNKYGDDKLYYSYDGGHIFVFSKKVLKKFCNYIMRLYLEEKKYLESIYDFRKKKNLFGGVQDLTFITMFTNEFSSISIDLSRISDNVYYDHNINLSEGFDSLYGKKKIFCKNKKLYVESLMTLKEIEIKLLHCQGTAKEYIESMLTYVDLDEENTYVFDYYQKKWIHKNNLKIYSSKAKKYKMRIKTLLFQLKKKIKQIIAMKK